jgi:hypothetical protein
MAMNNNNRDYPVSNGLQLKEMLLEDWHPPDREALIDGVDERRVRATPRSRGRWAAQQRTPPGAIQPALGERLPRRALCSAPGLRPPRRAADSHGAFAIASRRPGTPRTRSSRRAGVDLYWAQAWTVED